MTETPWTPGPWGVFRGQFINAEGGVPICEMHPSQPDRLRADARLIAAAPAMAELLVMWLRQYQEAAYPPIAATEGLLDRIGAGSA